MYITSVNNTKVKEWIKLKDKKYRDNTNLFIIESSHLVNEAQKNNLIKETISNQEKFQPDYLVTKEIMNKLTTQKTIPDIIAICYKPHNNIIKDKILVLDGLQDPGNLGTIIRSATAFNIDTIVLSDDSVDLFNEKVIRASEGMIFNINIIRTNLEQFLKNLTKDYPILITDVEKGENIKSLLPIKKFALLIGNEGQGVKESLKKYATKFVNIRMNSNCESLNAGIAASILMYEINEANYE